MKQPPPQPHLCWSGLHITESGFETLPEGVLPSCISVGVATFLQGPGSPPPTQWHRSPSGGDPPQSGPLRAFPKFSRAETHSDASGLELPPPGPRGKSGPGPTHLPSLGGSSNWTRGRVVADSTCHALSLVAEEDRRWAQRHEGLPCVTHAHDPFGGVG